MSNDIGELSGELYEKMVSACPVCEADDGYFKGPRGGMSVNVFCRNPECRAGFNICPPLRLAQTIGKCTTPYPADPDYEVPEYDDKTFHPNPTDHWYCATCEDLTAHDHWHDTAHGITDTHMAGTERYVCRVCGRTTHSHDETANHFHFWFDLP